MMAFYFVWPSVQSKLCQRRAMTGQVLYSKSPTRLKMKSGCSSSQRSRYPKGSTKTIRRLSMIGTLLMVAIVNLTPIPQGTLLGAPKFVSALSSTSHRGRRASLFHNTRRSRQIAKSMLSQSASTSSQTTSTDDHESRKTNGLLVRLLTGEKASPRLQKPKWLEQSSKLSALPTWLFHLRPSVQLMVTIFLYLFHTTVLTQNSIVLPIQLFPNDRGNFQSIGLDT